MYDENIPEEVKEWVSRSAKLLASEDMEDMAEGIKGLEETAKKLSGLNRKARILRMLVEEMNKNRKERENGTRKLYSLQ